jgi:hypothetical protein
MSLEFFVQQLLDLKSCGGSALERELGRLACWSVFSCSRRLRPFYLGTHNIDALLTSMFVSVAQRRGSPRVSYIGQWRRTAKVYVIGSW